MMSNLTHLGPYTLEERCGQGAFTDVWRARRDSDDERVLIKVYNSIQFTATDEIDRFNAEATQLASLRGCCLPRVYDHGVEGGVAWIAIEEVGGRPLQEVLSDPDQGPFDLQRALDIAIQATFALQEQLGALTHTQAPGNLGRVLNPWHLRLDDEDRVWLLGLTSPHRPFPSNEAIQQNPEKPFYYMAPEILRHEAGDIRSEVFALGAMLHAMLAGEQPFGSQENFFAARGFPREPTSTIEDLRPELPTHLTDLIATALKMTASARHADLERLLDALLHCPLIHRETAPISTKETFSLAREHVYTGDLRPLARLLHDHPTTGADPSLQDYLWDHLEDALTAPWRGHAPLTWSLWQITRCTPQIIDALRPSFDLHNKTFARTLARLLQSSQLIDTARDIVLPPPPSKELPPPNLPEMEAEQDDEGLLSTIKGLLGWQ